jgi:methyltransferase (TIGR00027 family)
VAGLWLRAGAFGPRCWGSIVLLVEPRRTPLAHGLPVSPTGLASEAVGSGSTVTLKGGPAARDLCDDARVDSASRTALSAALMRAVHTRLDHPALIHDPWGDRLVLAEEREAMLARLGADDLDTALRAHPAYGAVILRTRYAEDALASAVGRNVRQYVLVGAGLDSFALRRSVSADELQIFEVDHPATQRFKTDRLRACEIPVPAGLHLVPTDLGETSIEVGLAGSCFRSDQASFFSWLGVTIYLSLAANLDTLAAIAGCARVGSELVFDYVDQAVLDSMPHQGATSRARAGVAAAGEPWISGFDPAQLSDELGARGWELIANLGPDDLNQRYCVGRTDGLTPSPGAYVAHARVAP